MENKKKRHSIITIILIIFIMLAGFGAYWYFTNLYVSKECKEIREIATNMYNLENGEITSYTTKSVTNQVEDGEEETSVYIEEVDIPNKAIKWITQERYSGYVEDDVSYMTIENGKECRYERQWSNDEQEYYWYKEVYENDYDGQEATTLQFSALTALELIPLSNKVKLVSEGEDGTKVYNVTINKLGLYSMYDTEDIIDNAVFEIKIKDGYITQLYTELSNWYKEDNIDKAETTITIYNINNTSVSIPEEILNNLVEKTADY